MFCCYNMFRGILYYVTNLNLSMKTEKKILCLYRSVYRNFHSIFSMTLNEVIVDKDDAFRSTILLIYYRFKDYLVNNENSAFTTL